MNLHMKPKKKKEMPEFETIEAAIGGDARQSIRFFLILSRS